MSELTMDVWVAQPPAQVFEAIKEPFLLRRWYGAPPGAVRLGESGGEDAGEPFRVNLLDEHGVPFAQTGRLLEVYPDEGLLLELAWDGGNLGRETTRASLKLRPHDNGTRIELRQGPFSSSETQQAHRVYWETCLGRLARVASGEAVPCFEEFWEESSGFAEPIGLAAYTVLVGMREAGAAPETLAQLEEMLYTHLARLPEETARVLGAVLRERLKGGLPKG
ncbi:SRPBCC domain-containing protein [Vitiosangium sp. GDMCC 1.1324]|uniref:SRPBCC family protein n=1 Tax=Vitiosangium sp. (strain GDMCC 1.1324) TaxID=2138576 RepID=UPI000D3D8ADC|nr:SRPBCC domain-containing protein [Vitiosangium sp. GDMCC 1.1324]PTL77393.1 SRPBCC domain-containing protein [Vitiosangium sp. GDMCC 1.1324]